MKHKRVVDLVYKFTLSALTKQLTKHLFYPRTDQIRCAQGGVAVDSTVFCVLSS